MAELFCFAFMMVLLSVLAVAGEIAERLDKDEWKSKERGGRF